jgi:hypothetical protein
MGFINNKKVLLSSLSLVVGLCGVNVLDAIAGRIPPRSVKCYFFEGEKVKIENTCIYESSSWAGGGVRSLRWEDGVVTGMLFGLQGRGSLVCPKDETEVDGFCSKSYERDPSTLQRISRKESFNTSANQNKNPIRCVQVRKGSICWKF